MAVTANGKVYAAFGFATAKVCILTHTHRIFNFASRLCLEVQQPVTVLYIPSYMQGRLRRNIDTVGIYEVRRNPRVGTRLIPTWKFQVSQELLGPLLAVSCCQKRSRINQGDVLD